MRGGTSHRTKCQAIKVYWTAPERLDVEELSVLQHVAEGASYRETAEALGVGLHWIWPRIRRAAGKAG